MNILIDIVHPAHVHLFRNTIQELRGNGHRIWVTIRKQASVVQLLDAYDIPYKVIGEKKHSLAGKAWSLIRSDFQLVDIIRSNEIQLSLSTSIAPAQVSIFTRMDALLFDDDDDAVEPLYVRFGHPFARAVLTPSVVSRKSANVIRYPGTHELAYLHPKWFSPDPAVLAELGLSPEDKFFVLRFNAHQAHHDIGESGLTSEQKKHLISMLSTKGQVFVSEEKTTMEFNGYQLTTSPVKMHSLLAYATLFVGDSQTMTTEAAILGTPAFKCNSFAGRLSIPNELENRYRLCFSYPPSRFGEMLMHIETLTNNPDLRASWQEKRTAFLKDHIDVTNMISWVVENYPKSLKMLKEQPDTLGKFQ